MKGTYEYMKASLKYFDDHRCLSQWEESKCIWIHGKDSAKWVSDLCKPFSHCMESVPTKHLYHT